MFDGQRLLKNNGELYIVGPPLRRMWLSDVKWTSSSLSSSSSSSHHNRHHHYHCHHHHHPHRHHHQNYQSPPLLDPMMVSGLRNGLTTGQILLAPSKEHKVRDAPFKTAASLCVLLQIRLPCSFIHHRTGLCDARNVGPEKFPPSQKPKFMQLCSKKLDQ